jgi:putative heme-binding domain-containing protein
MNGNALSSKTLTVMRKILVLSLLLSLHALAFAENARFEIREGDRIALVGDTLIEREQEFGWLETVLYSRYADRHFTVRNLGWSADTPMGESRSSFDFADPNKGFEKLKGNIADVKPTVVFLGYGMASSFDGEAGLLKFKADMEHLIKTIQEQSSNSVRFVVLSPIQHFKMPAPLPDPTAHNEQLRIYTEALREIAQKHDAAFVDLFDWSPRNSAREISENGIHLNSTGYQLLAQEIARQLGATAAKFKVSKQNEQRLREVVNRKNHLYFDRWRPQNETYLLGFRKYEQGQNAKEIPLFDPLVKNEDDAIFQVQDLITHKRQNFSPKPIEPVRGLIKPDTNAPPQWQPTFDVAPGFEISLWAENPLLAKPIQMNFDPKGRLWVASSSLYPQILPGQIPDDKIIVLEDTKGSGKADKATVFADGLFLPTGVEPGDGGCYVGESTQLLHLSDSKHNGKADTRRVVLSAFGTEDTHHLVHTLRWGHDGMLYFDQSIYIHTHVETPHGVVRLNSGGVFNYRPATDQLEIFLRGFCNPWGHQFDKFGQSFVTDGAGYEGISFGIQGATYFTYASMRREMQSISPGSYPKFCGLEIIASKQFPDDWQGNMITADFRAHRLARFGVSEEGAGYVSKELPDLVRTTNVTFRPIDLKLGPDGALYVADWSNPIINHGEVDFRDGRRDHEHGRIWRIKAKDRPLLTRVDFTKLNNDKLLDELVSPNSYEVAQARRVLTERGKKIVSSLNKWTSRQTNDTALLQALWMYQSLDDVRTNLLATILASKDGHIRAAGYRVLSHWYPHVPQTMDWLAQGSRDPFLRARLEAVRALGKFPTARAAELVLNATGTKDAFLDYGIWLSINELAKPWLASVKSGEWKVEGHEDQLEFGLTSIEPDLAGAALSHYLKEHPLTRDGKGRWIELIGRAGTANELQLLYDRILNGEFDAAATERALTALRDAAKNRSVKPSSRLDEIAKVMTHDGNRIRAIQVAGEWKVEAAVSALVNFAKGSDSKLRDAAFESLRKIGGAKATEVVRQLASKDQPAPIQRAAITTLVALDITNAMPAAVTLLRDSTDADQAMAIWKSLLETKGAAPLLARALPQNGFPQLAGKAGLRAARETGHNDVELIVALTRAAGLQDAETKLTAAEMKDLGKAVAESGDAARGEKIFRRQQVACASCHSIGGVGGKVGPDLTSIGASSPVDYLIESVFYPNAKIKEGYHSFMIETDDETEVSGILVRENNQELVIRDASNKEISISKNKIRKKTQGGSLMPSGLLDALSHQEQLDLFKFLSELGKPGTYDASHPNVARLWKVAVAPQRAEQFGDDTFVKADWTGDQWHTAPTYVDGRLTRADLKQASQHKSSTAAVFCATEFRVAQDGLVPLDFTADKVKPVAAWLDGKPVTCEKQIKTDLKSGVHRLVLKFDPKNLPETIRVACPDAAFSAN